MPIVPFIIHRVAASPLIPCYCVTMPARCADAGGHLGPKTRIINHDVAASYYSSPPQ